MSSELGVLKFFTGKPLNLFNNLNVRSIFLSLNKKAEIGKAGYSEGELCNVASKYACLVFYLFLKFYYFLYIDFLIMASYQ